MFHDEFDQSLLMQLFQCLPGQRTPHFQSLRHDGRGDQLVGGNLFQQLFISGLVEEDHVVQLVAHLSLRPLLLLRFPSSSLLLLRRLVRRLSLSLVLLRRLQENVRRERQDVEKPLTIVVVPLLEDGSRQATRTGLQRKRKRECGEQLQSALAQQLMDRDGANDKRMAEDSPTNWPSYMSAKKAKLKDQFLDDVANSENNNDGLEATRSNLFAGMTIHTNGCAHPSNEELRELIGRHGGKHDFYYSKQTTTHVVSETLAYTKMKTFADCKVIRPSWIMDSIAQGKVLPCENYSVLCANHQPYQKGEAQVSDEENGDDGLEDPESEESSDELLVNGMSDERVGSESMALKAGEPGFLEAFFGKSRLHHLSTAGNDFKSYIQEKRNGKATEFVGLQRLKRFVKEMQLQSSVSWSGPMIMHIDMDCFFVSVGLLNKPLLRDKPVVVAHAKTGKGEQRSDQPSDQFNSFSELASCNYEARKFGVKNGMLLRKAMQLCPHLQIIQYNFEEYDRVSKVLYDLLSSFTLEIEAVSCDEMFVDVKSLVEEAKCSPKVFASFIRNEMKRMTQCNSSVGIGPNVLIAKLASKAAKPDNYAIITPEGVSQFMSDKQLQQLPGIGSSIASKLAEKFSAESCADMVHVPCERLREVFGKTMGEKIFSLCRGIDRSELKYDQASARKSVSVEVNYGIRFTEWSPLEAFIHELAQETSNRLQKIKAKGKCVTLKIKVRRQDAPVQMAKFMGHGICDNLSRSTLLSFPTDSQQLIGKSVANIFQSMKVNIPDLRGIAIQITKLVIDKIGQSIRVENPNSIQRFLLTSKPESNLNLSVTKSSETASAAVGPKRVSLTPQPTSMADIDPDFLKELPDDLRLEITNSFTVAQPSIKSSEKDTKSNSSSTKKGKRSPKKKAAAPTKPVPGPLDRMFSNQTSGSLERKVARIMSRTASLCGQTEAEKIRSLLVEWVSTEERLEDEDVAYVTKFLLDLVSCSKWDLLRASLSVLQW